VASLRTGLYSQDRTEKALLRGQEGFFSTPAPLGLPIVARV